MSESIHTTEQIREFVAYGDWGTEEYPVEWFDAWLAVHDAEVERAAAIKALEDASDEIELGDWSHHGNSSDRRNAEAEASNWLDKRAISLAQCRSAAALGLTAGQEGESDE